MRGFTPRPSHTAFLRLDRYILSLTPTQVAVDWVRRLEEEDDLPEDSVRFTLEEAQRYHRNTYLIPYELDLELVIEWLEVNFDLFFRSELTSLEPDPSRWPKDRTIELFEEWFDIEILDAPLDAVAAPPYLTNQLPPITGGKVRRRRDRI